MDEVHEEYALGFSHSAPGWRLEKSLGRCGKEASGRFEKSMEEARRTSEPNVSNLLAMAGEQKPKRAVTH